MISLIKAVMDLVRAAHPLLTIAAMNKPLALALALPLVACVVGSGTDTGEPGPGPGNGSGGGNGSGTGNGTGDHITSNTTWSGTMDVSKAITVDPGVTLTVAAGTTVKFGTSGAITVKGKVDIVGAKNQVVTLTGAGGLSPPNLVVSLGGELKMSYVVQTGGEDLVDGGKITIVNTRMSNAPHDLLVVNSGTVDMTYSAIGLEPGGPTDTTHCDLHFGGSGTTIKINNSNISTSAYGLMLYGGNNLDLKNNNWFSNPIQIDTSAGASADITGSWFDKGAPTAGTGATLTYDYQNPVPNRLPANMAGPQ
jgi:hypothetical protein